MYGRGNKGFNIADYLACGYSLFFFNKWFACCAYVLTKKNRELFWGRCGLYGQFLREMFVLGWVDAAGES